MTQSLSLQDEEVGNKMRVLVCGDRHWGQKKIPAGSHFLIDRYYPTREGWAFDQSQVDFLREKLDALHLINNFTCVIEGEAKGADTFGRLWAEARGVPVEAYPAGWAQYGHRAGPIRNKQMLSEGKPNLVVAFHNDIENSKGTKSMIFLTKKDKIPYIIFAQNKAPEFDYELDTSMFWDILPDADEFIS